MISLMASNHPIAIAKWLQVAHPQPGHQMAQGPDGAALEAWEPVSFILLVIFQLGALEVRRRDLYTANQYESTGKREKEKERR